MPKLCFLCNNLWYGVVEGNPLFVELRTRYEYGLFGRRETEKVIDCVFDCIDKGVDIDKGDVRYIEKHQLNNRLIIFNDYRSRVLSVDAESAKIPSK